ncbi:MAG: hypothetical protein AAB425_13985 [Bdellovibrionota bacterium]
MKPIYFGWISFFVTLTAMAAAGFTQSPASRSVAGVLPGTQSWEELMAGARKVQADAWVREEALRAKRQANIQLRTFTTPVLQPTASQPTAVDELIAAREKEKLEDIAIAEARAKAMSEAEAKMAEPPVDVREKVEADARAAAAAAAPPAPAAVGPSPENPYGDDGQAVFNADSHPTGGKIAHTGES